MKKVAITSKENIDKKEDLKKIVQILQKKKIKVYLDEKAKKNLKNYKTLHNLNNFTFQEKVDFVLSFGGDGRILKTVQKLQDLSIPIFGVNAGHLGFLSAIQINEFSKACEALCQKQYTFDYRLMLAIKIMRKGKIFKSFRALNEALVSLTSISRLVEIALEIDNIKVTNFRADGLIIATPTGSTAHSLSAGGPIIHPKMEAFIITPISPHSFTQKPVVITTEKIIKLSVKATRLSKAALTMDGQIEQVLEKNDQIEISCFPQKIKFIRFLKENYFKTLREKLLWGEGFNGGFN